MKTRYIEVFRLSWEYIVHSKNKDQIVTDMVKHLGKLVCLMNLKLHFLHSQLDYFPNISGDLSENQGKRRLVLNSTPLDHEQ